MPEPEPDFFGGPDELNDPGHQRLGRGCVGVGCLAGLFGFLASLFGGLATGASLVVIVSGCAVAFVGACMSRHIRGLRPRFARPTPSADLSDQLLNPDPNH